MIKKIYNGFMCFLTIMLVLVFSYCIGNSIVSDYHTYGLGNVVLCFVVGLPLFIGLVSLGELIRKRFRKGDK